MSLNLGIKINGGLFENSIYPLLDNLNAVFEVWSFSEKKEDKDFCLLEPVLYDNSGNVMYEMRKNDPT